MAIFDANNVSVNRVLNCDFQDSFAYCEFAVNQESNQQVLVQASMFDEGFDIDFCTLLHSANCRIKLDNLLSFLY